METRPSVSRADRVLEVPQRTSGAGLCQLESKISTGADYRRCNGRVNDENLLLTRAPLFSGDVSATKHKLHASSALSYHPDHRSLGQADRGARCLSTHQLQVVRSAAPTSAAM